MRIKEIIFEDFADDSEDDLSNPENSVSKSKNFGAILSVLEPLRQDLLFHHRDPQYPVDKALKTLNNLPDTRGAYTYETLKDAVDSGELDNVVEKLTTDSVSGKNMIIFKGNEIELPDDGNSSDNPSSGGGDLGGSAGSVDRSNADRVVSQMAKRAAS
jgi:hypothetical protein